MSSAIDVTWQQQYNLYLHHYRYHYQNYQRYLTGINETAEDMSLQRKPGCPKLEVHSLDVIDGDCSFELFTRIFALSLFPLTSINLQVIDLTDIERLSLHTLTLLLINLPQLQVRPPPIKIILRNNH